MFVDMISSLAFKLYGWDVPREDKYKAVFLAHQSYKLTKCYLFFLIIKYSGNLFHGVITIFFHTLL